MSHSQQVADLIRAEIASQESSLASLRKALAVLTGEPIARPAPKPRSTTTTTVTRGQRVPVSAEAVLDKIKHGLDQTPRIASDLGVSVNVTRARLLELEADKRITRTGDKRSTRWHVAESGSDPDFVADNEPVSSDDDMLAESTNGDTRRSAPVDDVYALVATGVSRASDVAKHLGVSRQSVTKRLMDLEREGKLTRSGAVWQATTQENWIEHRAREIAAA